MRATSERPDRDRTVTRTRLDLLAGAVVAVVLVVGVVTTVGPYATGGGEGMHGGGMHGVVPVWNLFGAIIVAAVIGGGYLLVRDDLHEAVGDTGSTATPSESSPPSEPSAPSEPPPSSETSLSDSSRADSSTASETDAPNETVAGVGRTTADVLRLLPDDERRVLEPVIESPGITQIELRDRSDFSKSKVSQTVSELEKRGLLYRESQGRTYRVYPADELSTDGGHPHESAIDGSGRRNDLRHEKR